MRFDEINFSKRNRRPVTDTTYQIAAEEWNALGAEMSRQQARLNEIDPDGRREGDAAYVTDAELEAYKRNVEASLAAIGGSVKDMKLELITYQEYLALGKNRTFRHYYVAKTEEDREAMKCWRIYLRDQLIGIFSTNGTLAMSRFPMRFPFRLA